MAYVVLYEANATSVAFTFPLANWIISGLLVPRSITSAIGEKNKLMPPVSMTVDELLPKSWVRVSIYRASCSASSFWDMLAKELPTMVKESLDPTQPPIHVPA